MRSVFLATALSAAATAAFAAGQGAQWAARPSPADIQAVLLPGAWEAGGRVILRCKAGPDGSLADCAPLAETQAGAGHALSALAGKYRLAPAGLGELGPDRQVVVSEDWYRFDSPPDWRRKPTPEQLRAVWPSEAWARGVNGEGRIDCLVAVEGSLYDCVVVDEKPVGSHFGQAAIALTPQFLMRPAMRNGAPVISEVKIPVDFRGASLGAHALTGRLVRPAISWAEAPTPADVLAAYPPQALAAKVTGFVSLQCGFDRDGRLEDCQTLGAEPKGQGFERAAKTLSKRFRLDPKELPGVRMRDAGVNLPVTFDAGALRRASLGKPVWTRTPDLDELRTAFANVKTAGSGGRAVLSCAVQQGGQLAPCAIASEQPAGEGLGATALALQGSFRLATWSNEGLPVVGETVQVPIRFDFTAPEPAEPGPAKSPPASAR